VGMEEQSRQKQMNEMLYGNKMDKERWVNEEKITFFPLLRARILLCVFLLGFALAFLKEFSRLRALRFYFAFSCSRSPSYYLIIGKGVWGEKITTPLKKFFQKIKSFF
jgi:hypothetical protein